MIAIASIAIASSTLSNGAMTSSTTGGSCTEYKCFDFFNKSHDCQCNYRCDRYNDCCSDFDKVCSAATCAVYGCHKEGVLCSCESDCVKTEECCHDFFSNCHGPSPPPSPPSPIHPSGPKGPPEQFHLAPGEDGTSVTVSYATGKSFHASAICRLDKLDHPSQNFTGVTTTYTDGGWSGNLHAVQLSGLAADGHTKYFYSCDGSETFSFTASPKSGTASFPMTIAAVADMGQECERSGGGCPNATFAALNQAAADGTFNLLLHAGDIAYTSGTQTIWDSYHRELQSTVAHVPYAVCPGNHEHYFNFSGYRHRYNMPGVAMETENLWWSFDWGGVHVLSYSTEHDYSEGSDQFKFIEKDLAQAASVSQRKQVPWIIVQGHRPFYCSTDDYYDCNVKGPTSLRPALEPLFLKYGVDLGLYGHLHNYERSWPISGNGTVEKFSYSNVESTVHVVIGGAGDDEGLTDRWESPQPEWSAYRIGTVSSMGYSRMTFYNESVMDFGWYLAANNTRHDGFTLSKNRDSASVETA